MKTGVELIAEERQRQVEEEGWTSEHDDQHRNGSLAIVGALYALPPDRMVQAGPVLVNLVSLLWPRTWDQHWWNPKDRIRDLTRAGALIAAEIDRLQRDEVRDG